ncbi:hypothetical protein DFH07DRAFT_749108 [Mycena maculata]|uniref:Uncharacterized protein n=1 Tax=Mycena maculata TaxID=230809 RepID=A0AAD7N3L6_9AGAR|nr:hypothetical protein DFH07DRAFT_749108 [Mycena maculata]
MESVTEISPKEQDKLDLGASLVDRTGFCTDYWYSEHTKRSWSSTIYAFFTNDVEIEYRSGQLHHVFTCAARGCGHRVTRNQTTLDRNSMKNLKKHTKKCWGADTVDAASDLGSLDKARELLSTHKGAKSARLTDIFRRNTPGGNLDYVSQVPLSKSETRLRPFVIAADRGFCYLMRSGRPTMWIPSPTTIARDVKLLFGKTRVRLRDRFHDRDRCVSLATDAWTSPNHRAFVAVTGHWEENGQKVDCLLDFIEVPKVRISHPLYSSLILLSHTLGIHSPTSSLKSPLRMVSRTGL